MFNALFRQGEQTDTLKKTFEIEMTEKKKD